MWKSSTPIRADTWKGVYGAAQTAISAADAALEHGAAYALARPPGHHAFADCAGGFCFLNNTAIAAQRLREKTGGRVAVLDIDVHHGDGTQGIFYARADVLTVSIHADPTNYFPLFAGYAEETGAGAQVNWARVPNIGSLNDKTVGIVGYGEIGACLTRMLLPFACRVLAYKRTPLSDEQTRYYGVENATLDDLLTQSDVVVSTVPYTPESRRMLGAREFGLMQRSAYFVNVGRGNTVDERALTWREGAETGHEQIRVRGEEHLRERARFLVRHALRHRQHRSVVHRGLLGVAAAGQERHDPLADAEAAHLRPRFQHRAGALEAEHGGRTGRRWIEPLALQQVGAIDRGGDHANANVGGAERRSRHVADLEDGLVPRLADDDGAHARQRAFQEGLRLSTKARGPSS